MFSFGVPNLNSSHEDGVRQKWLLLKSQGSQHTDTFMWHPCVLDQELCDPGVTQEEDISSQDEISVSHSRKKSTLWIKQHMKALAMHKM